MNYQYDCIVMVIEKMFQTSNAAHLLTLEWEKKISFRKCVFGETETYEKKILELSEFGGLVLKIR